MLLSLTLRTLTDMRERRNTRPPLFSHDATGFLVSASSPLLRALLELAARLWCVCTSAPELRGMSAVVQCLMCSAVPSAAPPTSPFMGLLIDSLAVRAQARFPHCSSVYGCICSWRTLLSSVLLTWNSSDKILCTSPASHSCRRRFNSAFLSCPW